MLTNLASHKNSLAVKHPPQLKSLFS